MAEEGIIATITKRIGNIRQRLQKPLENIMEAIHMWQDFRLTMNRHRKEPDAVIVRSARKKFQEYLKENYHTIEEFNERSGGIFWSQEYTHFGQIQIPVNSIEVGAIQQIEAFYENPTVRLEFERFASDSQIEYQNIQTQMLKKYTTKFVTTNATGLATNSIDYYKSTKALDTYAFDYYPGLRNTSVDSFPYAFARGVKEGKHFGVMEFMSGGGHRFSGSGRSSQIPEL